MLPVLICEADQGIRSLVSEVLSSFSQSANIRIVAASALPEDITRFAEAEKGITLTILGISPHQDSRETVLSLGRSIMRRNRDNYTVYLIHEQTGLQSILMYCERPSGIMLVPFTAESLATCLERIVLEYTALSEAEDTGQVLTLTSGTRTYRIPCAQISHIEALEKKLVVYTDHQSITLRYTLNNLIESLPECFIRCHRSYVVNMNYVRQFESETSLFTMAGGERIPISRSARPTIKQRLSEMGGSL